MDDLEYMASAWPHGTWSIGQVRSSSRQWLATLHRYGACKFGWGSTPREAFDSAVEQFARDYPDEMTAKRKQLAEAQETADRLERELAEGVEALS